MQLCTRPYSHVTGSSLLHSVRLAWSLLSIHYLRWGLFTTQSGLSSHVSSHDLVPILGNLFNATITPTTSVIVQPFRSARLQRVHNSSLRQ